MGKRIFFCSLLLLAIVFLTGFVWAEGEELYTIPHMAGSSEQTTPECQSMGGSNAANPTLLSGNPATLTTAKKIEATIQYDSQKYDKGLQLSGTSFRAVVPLNNFAIMFGANTIESNQFQVLGFNAETKESDFVFGLGYRVNNHFSIGTSFAPKMDTTTNFSGSYPVLTPLGPMTFPLNGELTSKTKTGGRYGVLYRNIYNSGSFNFGGYLDNFQETTRMTTKVGTPGVFYQEATSEDLFTTNRFRLGFFVENIIPKMDLSADFVSTDFRATNSPYNFSDDKFQFGLNYHFSKSLSVQAGSNGDGLTGGFAYSYKDLQISLGYQKNPHHSEMSPNFGGGSSLGISASYHF